MKTRLILLAISLIGFKAFAQPDEAYIKTLTGEINTEWLNSVAKTNPVFQLDWQHRKAPGFDNSSLSSRNQSILSGTWSFYSVDTMMNISNGKAVEIPHRFDRERNYNSGWYVKKIQLHKNEDKRYFILMDRVEMFSMLFVNGIRCGHHFGAYTPFEFEITDALLEGENSIAIFVYDQTATIDGNKHYCQVGVTRAQSGYRRTGLKGGMYGIPKIEIREKAYIKDIFVKTSTRHGEMEIEYELPPNAKLSADAKLSFVLLKWPEGEKVPLEIEPKSMNPFSRETKARIDKRENSVTVKWPDPELWSPDHPNLYVLRTTLENGKTKDLLDTRFGFREFWIEGKSFFLNGKPIRLRGNSIYSPKTPGRDFHREVWKKQKEIFGVNACRIHHTIPSGDLLLAADEAGILIDNQSSIWSSEAAWYKNGGEWFLANTKNEFEEWVRRDRNCPSVVIWDLENEMLRVSYEEHLPWVMKLPKYVLTLDDTRPLNHSGGGWFSPYQDMAWLHMQEQYCKIMRDWQEIGTMPLVIGEFWIGGRADFRRLPNSPEILWPGQEQYERALSYSEKMLEMRYYGVSGVMPFKLFSNIGIDSPKKMQQLIRHGISDETVFFWPRQRYAPSEQNFQREIVICNDGESENIYKLNWKWENERGQNKTVSLQPSEQIRIVIDEQAPKQTKRLIATIDRDGQQISSDTLSIKPIEIPEPRVKKTIQVYKNKKLVNTLSANGFKSFSNDQVPDAKDNVIWVIPKNSDNRSLFLIKDKILNYLDNGGAILCLKQNQESKWFPANLPFWSAYQSGIHTYALMGWEGLNTDLFYAWEAPNYAQSHPVFKGISDMPLHLWDATDRRISDHVYSRPSNINRYEPGNWRPLASGSRKHHVSLAEMFYGKGILFSCQLNVTDNLENAQAKTLFINMLNYLSERKPVSLDGKIKTAGIFKPSEIEQLTGVKSQVFDGAKPQRHNLMIAAEGARIDDVKSWAASGGNVLVLSSKVSGSFEGFSINDSKVSQVAKSADTPLLYGVCSASFSPEVLSAFKGSFSQMPDGAKDVFRGLSSEGSYSPVMASLKYGKGKIIFSTLEIQGMKENIIREFLCLMLTNAGVEVPYRTTITKEIAIKKTVPLKIDGKLNDWTNDMEDRLVTRYKHADPVNLTSESIVEGPPEFDLNLSAINYFMWNEDALNIAGVVFSEERTWESGVTWGSKKEYDMSLRINDDTVRILFEDDKAQVWINNKTENSIAFKTGQVDSKELIDAVDFQFIYIHKSGQIRRASSLIGETFELSIPWNLLKSNPQQKEWKSFMTVEAKGSKLQVPVSANPDTKDKWLKMVVSN